MPEFHDFNLYEYPSGMYLNLDHLVGFREHSGGTELFLTTGTSVVSRFPIDEFIYALEGAAEEEVEAPDGMITVTLTPDQAAALSWTETWVKPEYGPRAAGDFGGIGISEPLQRLTEAIEAIDDAVDNYEFNH